MVQLHFIRNYIFFSSMFSPLEQFSINKLLSINLNYNFGKQQKKRWNRRGFGGGRGSGGGMDMDY